MIDLPRFVFLGDILAELRRRRYPIVAKPILPVIMQDTGLV